MSRDGPLRACEVAREERIGLATLTARIALELDALAALADALDARMGTLIETGALRDPRYGVQDLDRLRQIAGDLATVQRRLADAVPHDVQVPVAPTLSRLQLGAMAHRLRTGMLDGDEDGSAGVELF
ncbi:MAG: hypothetical protein ACXIUV_14375 [Alkalilacustris sp.]